jgi:RNA polymerase sigma-70 factor (ECF subfamily)
LVIIVRNLSYNVYNKRKGLALLEHDEVKRIPDNEAILIEEHIIQMDFSSEMAKYLQQIHPPYADILTLRYYHESKVYEIAKVLEISENNASVRINRALMALRKVLEKEGVDYERKTV